MSLQNGDVLTVVQQIPPGTNNRQRDHGTRQVEIPCEEQRTTTHQRDAECTVAVGRPEARRCVLDSRDGLLAQGWFPDLRHDKHENHIEQHSATVEQRQGDKAQPNQRHIPAESVREALSS